MPNQASSYRPYLNYLTILFILFCAGIFLQKQQRMDTAALPEIFLEPPPETVMVDQEIPDFASMLDVQQKKDTFFSFLTPYIDVVNQQILQQRSRLLGLREKVLAGAVLNRSELNYLSGLRVEYELENEMLNTLNLINRLLKRADIIPHSLALAQAANESAWGTSRFAQDGNNFFGQWCYTEGCGIVPSQRREGARHEVKSFDSILDSVKSYIMNLNTFPSYQRLRDIRQRLREEGEPIDGIKLSEGLNSYSERGDEYIYELQTMIYSNNLLDFDSPQDA